MLKYLKSFSTVLKMFQSLCSEGKVDYSPSDMASNIAKDQGEEKCIYNHEESLQWKDQTILISAVKLI